MGQDLPRPGDDARRRRPPRPPRHHLRDERRELPPPRRPRTQTRPRPAAGPRDGQDRDLIVAARQSKRSTPLRDNYAATIMAAPRRRDSHPDCRCLPTQIAALHPATVKAVNTSNDTVALTTLRAAGHAGLTIAEWEA